MRFPWRTLIIAFQICVAETWVVNTLGGEEEFDGMNELYSVFAKVDDLRAILLGHGHGRDAFNKYIHYPQNIRKRI